MRARTFARIYEQNRWNGTETKAGPGSTMAATERLRAELPEVMARWGITSVLDAGCNEALWVPELPGYIGIDIVPSAIAAAKAHHPDRAYRVGDICTDELPRVAAVLCRDALQHLPLVDGLAAIANFRRAGAWVLFAGSHRGRKNRDVPVGGFYEVNLQEAPFHLGPPIWQVADGYWDDGQPWPEKFLGAWRLS
jgi:SAM-dependent methyltransferase